MTRAYQIATGGRGLATLAAGAGDRIAKIWHRYWEGRAKRATVELLHSLDDRTLRDIGVCRCEISSLVYGSPHDRIRSYDEAWRNWHAGG